MFSACSNDTVGIFFFMCGARANVSEYTMFGCMFILYICNGFERNFQEPGLVFYDLNRPDCRGKDSFSIMERDEM